MADEAVPPETSNRRSKRTKVQAQTGGDQPSKANGSGGDNQDRTSGPSDQSPNQVDREESFDDFEEVRPKAKRNRASEGTSAAPLKSGQSLIEVIKGNGKLIPQVVKICVEQYEKDPKPAMVELLMMLFEACGPKYHIKGDFLDETNVVDVVASLVDLARKGKVEDYQNSKRKEFQNFKDNLVSFWDNLVIECQNGPLFDQVLFDKCIDYVLLLSCSPPRVFCQVASLMGLQLVTSFINVATMLGAQWETTQRLLNAEKKKQTEGPCVESLNKRLSTMQKKITVIEEMMRKIYTGLFVERYRDVAHDIWMSCIQALGVWIMSYPPLFFKDLNLKYLGWALNDRSKRVRKASVLALQNLYEVDDHVPSLGPFTGEFYTRMIQLANDISVSVAVCAIGLIKQLLRHQLLSDNDLRSLYVSHIDDDQPKIRRAIGALLYDHLKFLSSQSGRKGDENDSSEVHLCTLLQILSQISTDPVLMIYAVDDVWEYMTAIKDWKCIISMLLDKNPSIELADVDATNLIRLLCASVKKAVGERIVPATDSRKQYYNKAQRKIFEENRSDITVAMMKNYPRLLHKFMADKAKVPSLAEIVVHMNLELYSPKRQTQNFKTVLQLMKEAFFKHGETDALRSCVKAINFCSSKSQGELQDYAQDKLKELEDELIAKLKSAIKGVTDGDDERSLLVNLKRLYELLSSRAVPIGSLYDDIVTILKNFRNVDDEVVSFLLLTMYLHVAWCLHSIITCETVSEVSFSSVLSKRATLFEQIEYLLNPPPEVQEEGKYGNQLVFRVCVLFAEVWCLFRKTNFSSTKLERLGYCPDASVLQKFWKLCEQQLKISDETEEDMNKEHVEEKNRYAVMIAVVNLVASDVVPKDYLCPEIISHFMIHGASVADIVKQLIAVQKKKEDDISNVFLEALGRAYHRRVVDHSRSDDETLGGKSFLECKDLAARLSGTFMGTARNKHRSDILKIVKGGIEFAFEDAPRQLSFLEVAVLQFISKLPTSDVLDILKDVQKRTENIDTDEDPSGWRPYYTFVDILGEKYAKNDVFQDEKEGTSVRRRGVHVSNVICKG